MADKNLQNFPSGLSGCQAHGNSFDFCDYDIIIFDGKHASEMIIYGNDFVNLHHHSINDTATESLIHLDGMQIIQDDSWELGSLLSTLKEKRLKLFEDYAKNCLIYSLFCCERCSNDDIFYQCWQKCASYFLADAILALNQKIASPSHTLEIVRNFEKNSINEKMSLVTQTLGIERATPSLLERMLKSTMGFSDMNHSIIQNKHDYFVKNSMLSDCYFYFGYLNKTNFIRLKDSHQADLIYILKTAFDLESDSTLIAQHTQIIQDACHEILSILRK